MCPLIKEIKRRKNVNCIVCVTGQHREMLDQVLDVFKITPDYNFSIMKKNQTLYDITYLVMEGMKKVLKQEKPECCAGSWRYHYYVCSCTCLLL